jgi:hypothetical protein
LKALSDSTARKVALILVGAVAVGLLVGVLISAGSDDSSDKPVTPPELTIPGDSSTLPDNTSRQKKDNQGTTGQSQTGGAQAPQPSQPSSPDTTGGAQGGGTQGGGDQGGDQAPGQGTDQSGGAGVPPSQ